MNSTRRNELEYATENRERCREMQTIYRGGGWTHLGNTVEQNQADKTGEAKLDTAHMRQGTIEIKQEIANTEIRTEICELNME